MNKKTIAMLGAGSWGTAVAIHLAKTGHRVLLWGHNPQHVALMESQRANPEYLPGIKFPNQLIPSVDLHQCLNEADYVIIAVPSHAFAELLTKIDHAPKGLTWLTKGVDPLSHHLLSELVSNRFGPDFPVAVVSGPSFAKEVAKFLPTVLTLACNNPDYQKNIHKLFHHDNIRVYLSEDLIGVQLCGAVKNILAIACGISDGLGYGSNAKAALITRGLAEMSRLGLSLGAKQDTFIGLAGVGDLVLTCTDDQSRNRRFGLLLGKNVSIEDAEKQIGQVVEGKNNAAQVCAIAKNLQIEMPICEQINALLQNKINAKQAVVNLMSRPAKEE
ncbi:NAD(P)H-dependent glycerol-3-phosphate dehydrogenase [Legionella bononiensis]|uniref:Glycerol-3-phosphate dehydrogenase [NAD(P)+] n=1 Tax=Legionella bononiensis TaxID=2793102 RepID=A0ABS1WB20_9GAMM|nr:NAD(P)H-dependent glycerol-3-phosphate dehydrogenase [Legionella bononiensis]MBL7480224.1 NAD(P)-dependent glycerol-3-phosphate dehydrogenase [Legionella bononiensis]MBL7526544.1 NAD(P)-dependent glycerol-3-phosphate dehydrogenase [Legionella bononiensis]MBL7562962.1 NAD(P)-dependent glycerol-3-phosphate dehydrogenase [Legionella bononiensis]